jgi:hypothetical protein
VLTGCAAAVPLANGQELSVDNQLIAEWYADHVHQLDESYSMPVLAQLEQDQFAEICFQKGSEISLLENLPEFPIANQVTLLQNIPISQGFLCFYDFSEIITSSIVKSDFCIRAPVWV